MYRIVILVFFASLGTVFSIFNVTRNEVIRFRRQSNGQCVLPPYPVNGHYSVGGAESAKPGQVLNAAQLLVTCQPGYRASGAETLYCVNGMWSNEMPTCVLACRLDPHPSVTYRCFSSGDNVDDFRECRDHEPSGTIVRPQCNSPNYYYSGALSYMRCIEGRWNYVAICQPECGRITPDGKPLVIEGRPAKRGEFPWHAGIYLKTSDPNKLICGGSIVSTSIIISAAHCFWRLGHVRPASEVAVAVGKFYRDWNNPQDDEAQKFDVTNIKIPARYQDARTNYQDDVAIVTLSATIVYRPYVRPVCMDFDEIFNRYQLKENSIGKVAGWGLVDTDGTPSPVLKVLEVPYVRVERCIDEAPSSFRPFITSDKICAGYTNGSTLCRGDSGGGLVFPAQDHGTERYYLRGIVSTAAESSDACNAFARTTFTHIIKHKGFIEENTILFETPVVVQQETVTLCVLPSHPAYGHYDVVGTNGASPGQAFYTAQIQVKCDDGYTPDGHVSPSCSYGRWSSSLPQCVEKVDPCNPSPCGPNSNCRTLGNNNHIVCVCATGFSGVPPDCFQGCANDDQCPNQEACIDRKCKNPCRDDSCTKGVCRGRNHKAICLCTGNTECEREDISVIDLCTPSPCGVNTVCTLNENGTPKCSCAPDYSGVPLFGCQAISNISGNMNLFEENKTSNTSIILSVPSEELLPPMYNLRDKECKDDKECGSNVTCIDTPKGAECTCNKGYKGTPPKVPCTSACEGFNCGNNSYCSTDENQLSCVCLPGFSRNVIDISAGCVEILECGASYECPEKEACLRSKCVSPCTEQKCGYNAECEITHRDAACKCLPNFFGNPYAECEPISYTSDVMNFFGENKTYNSTFSVPSEELLPPAGCKLPKDPSRIYKCFNRTSTSHWPCNKYEKRGTYSLVECNNGYRSLVPGARDVMQCNDAAWSPISSASTVKCSSECGMIPLNQGPESRHRTQSPWSAILILDEGDKRKFLCGATVVSPTLVITAAHCVWDYSGNQFRNTTDFDVVAGTEHPVWDDPRDSHRTQTSKLEAIIPSELFFGFKTNLGGDIAALRLKTPLKFNEYVQPACVDFDEETEKNQYKEGYGISTSWNIITDGKLDFKNAELSTYMLSYVEPAKCVENLSDQRAAMVTIDKQCFRATDGNGSCRGDSGLGILYPRNTTSGTLYTLRGVVSISLEPGDCSKTGAIGATQLQKHASFLKSLLYSDNENWQDIFPETKEEGVTDTVTNSKEPTEVTESSVFPEDANPGLTGPPETELKDEGEKSPVLKESLSSRPNDVATHDTSSPPERNDKQEKSEFILKSLIQEKLNMKKQMLEEKKNFYHAFISNMAKQTQALEHISDSFIKITNNVNNKHLGT